MLRESFYKIMSKDGGESSFTSTVAIHPEHEIFHGHFPGNPVVPGVCMLQIIKDLLEDHVGHSFRLQSIGNVKFIAVVDPFKNPILEVNISYQQDIRGCKVNSIISSKEIVFLKIINAVYI